MGDSAFLDTNIVLRLLNAGLPHHDAVKRTARQLRAEGYDLWISRQVIREYLVQVTRPGLLATPLRAEIAVAHVNLIYRLFNVADETRLVTDQLMELLPTYPTGGKQIHDANIVASMLAHQIGTLVTLNLDDFKRFAPLIKVLSPLEA